TVYNTYERVSAILSGETTEIPVESGETELEESSAVAEGELASTPAAVMTEAGVLSARRVELRREGRPAFRIWFSETVPLLGIARAEHPGGVGWELLAYGDSSRLLFDEAGAKRRNIRDERRRQTSSPCDSRGPSRRVRASE